VFWVYLFWIAVLSLIGWWALMKDPLALIILPLWFIGLVRSCEGRKEPYHD